MPSSSARGKIEVRTRSPGTTSAIHAPAAARACCPTPPSATIIARPMVSAPTVSAARDRSRRTDARASRSSRRASSRNGVPATRARPGRTARGRSARPRAGRRTRRHARTSAASPAARGQMSEPDDADDREHRDQPAQPRTSCGWQVEPGPQRLDRWDVAGPASGLDGSREGHPDADHERRRWRRRRERRVPPSGHGSDGADPGGDAPRRATPPSNDAHGRPR